MCMSVDKWFSIPPVEKVKKSGGKICNEHTFVLHSSKQLETEGNVNACVRVRVSVSVFILG